MSIIFTSEGFFKEGDLIGKKYQYEMELGKIILNDQELALMKRSNIGLTEIGTSVDNYKDGFKIPLSQIQKAYAYKHKNIYVVKVETRDDLVFTITMAQHRNISRMECMKLSELINTAVLNSANVRNVGADQYSVSSDSRLTCPYCGEKNKPDANFCKNCGKSIS